MDKATFLELMDKYIDGAISNAEKNEFDQMLINDPSLQQELSIHKALRRGIKLSGREALISELNEIKKEIGSTDGGKVLRLANRWYLAIAAIFVCLIAVTWLFNKYNNRSNDTQYVNQEVKNDSVEHNEYVFENNLDTIGKYYDKSIFTNKSNAYYKSKESSNNYEYQGKIKLRIMPKEGNLGSPIEQDWHVSILNTPLNRYRIDGDTITIMMDSGEFSKLQKLNAKFTIDSSQRLKIDIKNEVIFLNKLK